MQLATAGAVGLSIVFPSIEVGRIALSWVPHGGKGTQALVATACYLPLYVRHVLYAARGTRPAGAGWTLAAMAVVMIGAVPILGIGWLASLHALGVSVLIVVRMPWSLVIFAGLVAVPIPLAIALGGPHLGPYYSAAVAWRSMALFVVIWLISAIRELEAARLRVAEAALTRERLRIDDELRRTVGAGLEAIAARGERAGGLAGRSTARAETELHALVEGSRRTLAEARRIVRGYQQASLRDELDTAATLLTAAGIDTRVVLVGGEVPDTADETLRSALRSATARLLRDEAARSCVITVVRRDGGVQLELRYDRTGSAMTEVTAT